MVALGRMARSQEKINESQKLTIRSDVSRSPFHLAGTTRRDADGNDERTESRLVGMARTESGEFGVARGNFKLCYLQPGRWCATGPYV